MEEVTNPNTQMSQGNQAPAINDEVALKKIKNAKSTSMTLGLLITFLLAPVSTYAVYRMIVSTPEFPIGLSYFLVGLLGILFFGIGIFYILNSQKLGKALRAGDNVMVGKVSSSLFITSIVLAVLSISSLLVALIFAGSAYYFYQSREAVRK